MKRIGMESSKKGSTITTKPHGYVQVLSVIVFSIALLFSLVFNQPFLEKDDLIAPAMVISVFAIYSFFLCGRHTINASSIASYGVLMFIGFPALYGAMGLFESKKAYTARSLVVVLILAFVFQSGLVLASKFQDNKLARQKFVEEAKQSGKVLSQLLRFSFLAFVLFLLFFALGISGAASGLAWVAMLSGTVVAIWSSEKNVKIRGTALVLSTFIVQTGLNLGSFGRLNLAVLALSLILIASLKKATWTFKILTASLTGPILFYLVSQRLAFLQEERGSSDAVSEAEGLGSVVGPFHSAGTIVESRMQGQIPLAWGETLFNASVTGIPRAMWPEKPVGFGREIVEVTQPWLLSSDGFSDAGTFIGEAVWNFGVILAPVYLLGFIWLIRMLDTKTYSFFEKTPDFPNFIMMMLIALLSGTLLNVVWGSASTAAARTLIPLVLLVAVWFYTSRLSTRRTQLKPEH